MLDDQIRNQERMKVDMEDDVICIIVSMDREVKGVEVSFPIPIRIEDISTGGLKFWTRQEVLIGLILNFRIRVDGHIIDCKAKILRSQEEAGPIYLVAAKFQGMSTYGQHLIRGYIKRKRVQNIWQSRKKM